MGNFAGCLMVGALIAALLVTFTEHRWECESPGYVVTGRAGTKDGKVRFFSIVPLGLTPELEFPADKCRKAP